MLFSPLYCWFFSSCAYLTAHGESGAGHAPDQNTTLLWLLAISFLAATLLPGGFEAALFALLKFEPALCWYALLVATLGNVLGGLTSYFPGQLLPQRDSLKALSWVRRYGSPALLFAWAPLIGDALCVAAGWLRLNWLPVTLFMAIGKFARYWVIAQAAQITL